MKHLREKVNANTATPEETVEFEKVVEQKRKSSQAIRLRSKQSKKKNSDGKRKADEADEKQDDAEKRPKRKKVKKGKEATA